ncbi:MAG: LysM peptidoglycan-binding domain-containing protein, partial [Candidatus Omnitrophica bacterium]|nr:LysM peptidoglycan-binding domain-containing protein [Candidatus Omnitrophota bacterium]
PKTPTKPKKSIEEIKIIKKMLPESYYESELETRVEEKEVLLEKEIISLRRRLKEATNQLILANQKIKELKEKTYKPYTTQTYIVQKGDCLWSIAGRKEIYGDPYKWLLLYHANKDQIRNPNLIFPNMVIIIPRLEEYERKK